MIKFKDISDKQFENIVLSSTTWNEILSKCGLKIITRSFQRKFNKLDYKIKKHLPSFYGGLYSKIGKYTDDYYKDLIKKYNNWDDVLEILNFTTLQCMNNVKKHLDKIGIDYSHLSYPKKLKHKYKTNLNDILIENSLYTNMTTLKFRLISELNWEWKCSGCNKSTYSNNWLSDVPIPLEIDHINGTHDDNRIENLRFLCPNCHALTDTYKGKNMRVAIENKQKKEEPEAIVADILNNIITNIEKTHIKTNEHQDLLCIDCKETEVSRKSNRCIKCNNKHKFNNATLKVENRPSLEQLEKELKELGGYCAVGRKYGVSDNCIRKWIKKYKTHT